MKDLAYLLWYLPIGILAPLILQAVKHDDLRTILKKGFKDFAYLTAIFFAAGMTLFLIHLLL